MGKLWNQVVTLIRFKIIDNEQALVSSSLDSHLLTTADKEIFYQTGSHLLQIIHEEDHVVSGK